MNKYNHKDVEGKWQEKWDKDGIYKTDESSEKENYYVLDMFPYPSGDGLHVGHPKGYIATDVFSRYKRMTGFNVLHPMGWDAFGLPAENYAIKNKIHPRIAVEQNIAKFKSQLKKIGFTYDWEREINTTDPEYYKWTQWIFLKLYEKGLAYESYEPINWCPSCKTGLANEDLESGKCERCGSVVIQKPMRQWVLKIRDYADKLVDDIDKLDWPKSIKESQRNWIGRSYGTNLPFKIKDSDLMIETFTTRPDTIFGVTYLVLAPENELVDKLKDKVKNIDEVLRYRELSIQKNEIERTSVAKDKTGVELEGVYAINPLSNEEMPIYVADYVLNQYGTGAIISVPAHDDRDYQFALKYNLPIVHVIQPPVNDSQISISIHDDDKSDCANELRDLANDTEAVAPTIRLHNIDKSHQDDLVKIFEKYNVKYPEKYSLRNLFTQTLTFETKQSEDAFGYSIEASSAYTGRGTLINSDQFNGLDNEDAKQKICESLGVDYKAEYRLKNWVFSRQRYWGEPIPIIHCEKCGVVPVPEKDLPVVLPEVESYEPTGTGESPLADIDEWVNVGCPKCGGSGKRETNTMPQWAGSSWYYLRFIDPNNQNALVDKTKEEKWSPVNMYVGGAEHATRHLIYARFWHKFLFDIGVVSKTEPFMKLANQGLIQAEDGRKMSKRWGNVINPDDVIDKLGADTLRVYEMFMGPFSQAVSWSTDGIVGPRRFLERVWRLKDSVGEAVLSEEKQVVFNQTMKKVTEDIEDFNFNTAISQMMIFVNEFEDKNLTIPKAVYEDFLKILSPFAPHITEELWHELGNSESIHLAKWPTFDESKITQSVLKLAVQVNGKVRGTIEVPSDSTDEQIFTKAKESGEIAKWLEGSEIKKELYIKGRIVSFVI